MAGPRILPQEQLRGKGVYLLDDHEVIRRGLRYLLESAGLSVVGESGSAREAARRIPALRPDLVILDDELQDGSGADVCRAVAAADPGIRCVLMTGEAEEAVLIDSILAGAWGCLSKWDDSTEQLRLIGRALAGHTAYSDRLRAPDAGESTDPAMAPSDAGLRRLTSQERNAALGLARGLSNRQISQEMFLAEKTVKNMMSSVLMKLGMAHRSQVAVLVSKSVAGHSGADYRSGWFPDLIAEVAAALVSCTTESGFLPPTAADRAAGVTRLSVALAAARTGMPFFSSKQPRS